MKTFEVELEAAERIYVEIEAENLEEAREKAAYMIDEDELDFGPGSSTISLIGVEEVE